MNISKKIGSLTIVGWSTLGFYRGCGEYNYEYNKKIKYYEKELEVNKKYNNIISVEKPTYFYTTKIYNGFIGVVLYLFPISIPHIIIKEIYRIEINFRNIKQEKETEYYNRVFI